MFDGTAQNATATFLSGVRRALTDQRVQDLVARFYELRGTVRVDDPAAVRDATRSLFDVVADTIDDHVALRQLEAAAATAAAVGPFDAETGACIRTAADLALGPAFTDLVAGITLACEWIGVGADGSPEAVIPQLDEILGLTGLFGESEQVLMTLWRDAADDHATRDRIWTRVTTLLRAVADHCSLPAAAP